MPDAGAVNVIYGTTGGLSSVGAQFWTQDSPGILDQADAKDLFGRSLAAGDFNGDGYADLAIGVPYEGVVGNPDEGAVAVIYGSPAGLTDVGNQFWTQDSPGIQDRSEPHDRMGRSVASGDFNADGIDDLAIGVPLENVGNIQDAGAVNILYGSVAGLSATGNQLITQDSTGILNQSDPRDWFGWAMTADDFTGDGIDDLAVGVPGEVVNGLTGAGGVSVVYGSTGGLISAGNQFWTQDSLGLPDGSDASDLFGRVVRSGDFNGDGVADLAIGVPGESLPPSARLAGAVNVMYGEAGGLTTVGAQFWTQDSPGILDQAEKEDHFGRHIGTGDFNGDGFSDLAIGVVGEDLGLALDAGAVNVIFGTSSGLTDTDNQFWTQDSTDILGDSATGDRMGRAVAGFDFNADGFDDLAAGVPGDMVGTATGAGSVNVIYGSSQGPASAGNELWTQDSLGLAEDGSEPDDAFGSDFPGAPAGATSE
jgi:hypothetical protein